ncbi:DNA-binding protein, 42 kDa [Spizellomyces punctatus DAOM BR117]|uniref:DNA-binding protein, 42 kDa n=1 Tax=Spizellomyces punctatus (strain DAOM BR117) TaxID=645134 RepID=A0A0L0HMK3_SPIPD|nr:DNA-binding protein, 42 kDa [Spizellomyces punctatus DAOM BR117]KND02646.1 DNA-binding protein, 42 kDa [Spizellomyces punctatus DAOM BR117]|eukprot:XP_016610685.1 DNA-binding protein, 42 kDa [Spizellomyces punctatus DAOM BR117]
MAPPKNDPVSDVEEDDHSQSEDENELSSNVVTKYQTAADIANRALKKVIDAVVDGAKVVDLCALGDRTIEELAEKVFNKGKILKGIAFPTCVSSNTAICHMSPLSTDPEGATVLKKGDVVRLELGAHIDGYIAQVAHTVVIGASKETPITGRQADAFQAAYLATEAAIRLLKPGKTNVEVTDAVQSIAEDFECKPVEGMLSHQVLRNVLDGSKQIILNPTETQRKDIETQTFEEGEVYSLDILVSTGDGKPKTLETRTTVYKRQPDVTYNLKMKTSREVLSKVNKQFGSMAFSLRHFDDEKKARMGIVECANHNLVVPYQVLYEKEEAVVAHFMFTVLLMPGGPLKITSFPWDQELVKSEKEIKSENIKELLKQPVSSKKANKKKKKKTAAQKGENGAEAK